MLLLLTGLGLGLNGRDPGGLEVWPGPAIVRFKRTTNKVLNVDTDGATVLVDGRLGNARRRFIDLDGHAHESASRKDQIVAGCNLRRVGGGVPLPDRFDPDQ